MSAESSSDVTAPNKERGRRDPRRLFMTMVDQVAGVVVDDGESGEDVVGAMYAPAAKVCCSLAGAGSAALLPTGGGRLYRPLTPNEIQSSHPRGWL